MKAGLASEMKSEAICAGNMNITAADVKERPHPRQQDGYLPRRYRKNMCEFSEK